MIRSLHLRRFGRFQDAQIEIGKTTIIHGGNESGKTTIFDAVRAALCGETLARYGDGASVTVEPAVTAASDTGCLHCIGEGDPHTLVADLDARLRAVTVDVAQLSRELEALASDDPDQPHNRRLAELAEQLEALQARRAELWDARRTATEARADTARLDSEIEAQTQLIQRLDARVAELEEQLAAERQRDLRWRHHRELEERLAALEAQATDLLSLSSLDSYEEEELVALDRLEAEVESHQNRLRAIQQRAVGGRTRMQQVVDQVDKGRAALPKLERVATRATALKVRVERLFAEPTIIERREWRGSRVLLSTAALALLAAVSWLGGLEPTVNVGLGLALGSVALLLGRRTVREEDRTAATLGLMQLREQWNRDDSLPRLDVVTAAEMIAFCDEQIRACHQSRTRLDDQIRHTCRGEEELATILERSAGALSSGLEVRQQARDAWLAERGIESRELYAAKVEERRELQGRIEQRQEMPSEIDACLALAEEVRARLELAGPQVEEPIAELLDELSAQLLEVRDERLEASARRETLRAERPALVARIEAIDVPTELHSLDAEQRQIEEAIAQIDADRRTARAASAIFARLAQDNGLHLSLLEERVAALIAATGEERGIALQGASEQEIALLEADGSKRVVAEHGRGTRDLLLLAFRLAVAERLGPHRLVLLEEPFARLDARRRAGALAMLSSFQMQTGWQVILITRDASLVGAAADLSAETTVVDLANLA